MTNPFRPARAGFEQDDRPPGPERDRPGRDDGAVTDSPFRQAVEAQDADRLTAALHPDVVFRSPAVHAPYTGRDAAMAVLRAVLAVFEQFRYVAEVRAGADEVLRFAARVGDREVDGVDIVRYDPDGLVTELTVMIRPMSALHAVAEAVGAQLARGTGGTGG